MLKIYSREAFYVKSKQIPKDVRTELIDSYVYRFYDDKSCNDCEYMPERHCDVCDSCAMFKGGVQLSKEVKIGDSKYVSFPVGDIKGLISKFRRHDLLTEVQLPKIVSKHAKNVEFRKPIKFLGKLRPYQRDARKAIVEKKKGIVKAPPRSGKTVISTAAICKIGNKTIIMAAQREWLVGFYETFCGERDKQGNIITPPMTNARGSGITSAEMRAFKASGKRAQIGFCRTLEDFKKHDICLVTYQTFNSEKGQKLLRKIRDWFSVLVVDEVHGGAANKYALAISSLNCEWKIGLSGTPSRKDMRFVLMDKLMGPIIYDAKVERLKPTIKLVRTAYVDSARTFNWTSMVTKLETNPARLKLIAQQAIKDAKAGHMVLIPMVRVKAIKALTEAINRIAGKKIAHSFIGQGMDTDKRKDLIARARKYKIKILVGNSKLLSTGINIPRASCIYEVSPSSNLEGCEQRISRILTPWDDKPPPLVRVFMDELSVRKSCFSKEFWQCIWPKFKPVMTEPDLRAWKEYLASAKTNKAKTNLRMDF